MRAVTSADVLADARVVRLGQRLCDAASARRFRNQYPPLDLP
jgi:hypothetical protein